jgi:hypothetical protein
LIFEDKKQMLRIILGGCLTGALAGCASVPATLAGTYRADCQSLVIPVDARQECDASANASRPKSCPPTLEQARQMCEAFNAKPENRIRIDRDASGGWTIQTGNEAPAPMTAATNPDGYLCGSPAPFVQVCQVPRNRDVFRMTGMQLQSRTGVVQISMGGFSDLVKVEGP